MLTNQIGIRDNVEAFGGDPNKVTAVGQSVWSKLNRPALDFL